MSTVVEFKLEIVSHKVGGFLVDLAKDNLEQWVGGFVRKVYSKTYLCSNRIPDTFKFILLAVLRIDDMSGPELNVHKLRYTKRPFVTKESLPEVLSALVVNVDENPKKSVCLKS